MASKPVRPDMAASDDTWSKYGKDVVEWNLENPHDPIRLGAGTRLRMDRLDEGFGGDFDLDDLGTPRLPVGDMDMSKLGGSGGQPFQGLAFRSTSPLEEVESIPAPSVLNPTSMLPSAHPEFELSQKDVIPSWSEQTLGKVAKQDNWLGDKVNTTMLAARVAGGDPTATAELAAKEIEKKIQALNEIPQHLMGAMKAESAGGTLSEGFGAVENVGTLMRGTGIGEVIEGLGTLGKVTFGAIDGLEKLGKTLLDANFKFAEFSGSMGVLKANQEVFDALLNLSKGEARSGSTAKLQEELNKLNVTLTPLENQLANLKNEVLALMLKFIFETLKVRKGIENIIKWLEYFGLKADEPKTISDFMEELEKKTAEFPAGRRPPRFR